MQKKFCLPMIFFLSITAVLSADIKKISVLKFSGQETSESEAETVSDLLSVLLVQSKKYIVLDRSDLKKILEEQDFQNTGCTDASCAVQIGKIICTDYIITGALSRLDKKFFITANIVNVETGEIIRSAKTAGFGMKKAEKNIALLAEQLTSGMTENITNDALTARDEKNPGPSSGKKRKIRSPETTGAAVSGNSGFYGLVTGGLDYKRRNSENSFIPYFNYYGILARAQGVSMRSRLDYQYNKEKARRPDLYVIDDLYFYADYKKNSRRSWYFLSGTDSKSVSPVNFWGLETRGINGGIFPETDSPVIINPSAEAFYGVFKNSQPAAGGDNGTFMGMGYFGSLSTGIGRMFNLKLLYGQFYDLVRTLEPQQRGETLPEKNHLLSSVLYFHNRDLKGHASYAYSITDFNRLSGADHVQRGNAVYGEAEKYIGSRRLFGQFRYVDRYFYSLAANTLESDIIKIDLRFESPIKALSISGGAGLERGNTDFDPKERVLTSHRYNAFANLIIPFLSGYSATVRAKTDYKISLAQVNASFDNIFDYSAGLDISQLITFKDNFRNLKNTVSVTWQEKLDNSIISGSKSAMTQQIIDSGIYSRLDVNPAENNFSFNFLSVNASGRSEYHFSGSEKLAVRLLSGMIKPSLRYSVQYTLNERGGITRFRHTYGAGGDLVIRDRSTVTLSGQCEDFTGRDTDSYKEYTVSGSYNFVF